MKLDEVPEFLRNEYNFKCRCGRVYKCLAQVDEEPEYYTALFLRCDCGEYVKMVLPVN